MKRGQSITRKFRRGNLVSIWNSTLQRPDVYRKIKKGYYRLTNPYVHNSAWGPRVTANQLASYRLKSITG